MNTSVIHLVILSLATATISVTVTQSKMFKWVRFTAHRLGKWPGELASCPYCISHWISLGFTLMYQPTIVKLWIGLDLAVSALSMIAIAAICSGIIIKLIPFAGARMAPVESGYDQIGR